MKDYVPREALIALARPGTFATSCDGAVRQEDAVPVRVIQGVPAGDVAEARRGRWIKEHDEVCYWLACSACGEKIPKRYGTDYYTNYCPNCGAKMCGGVEEEE